MSLISPKNFVAPFFNAVNLATIIVVAVLFAIYRFSGGGVSISSRKNVAPVVREAAVVKNTEQEKPVQVNNDQAHAVAVRPSSDDKTLGDLLDRDSKLPAPSKPNSAQKPRSSSLDDIAKQLGVE